MVRTQIHLPDDLYRRAKRFGAEREISLAEVTRRGLELLLDRHPKRPAKNWKMPTIDGEVKVPLEKLRDYIFEDQEPELWNGKH